MIKHIGHHHHYHKPPSAYPTYEQKLKRTANTHYHESPGGLEHLGNSIYGGPCICDDEVWEHQRGTTAPIHESWAKIKDAYHKARSEQNQTKSGPDRPQGGNQWDTGSN
jgi:hypothetical protein